MSVAKHFFPFGNMSRIGAQKIAIPNGVEVSFGEGLLQVKGPNGALSRRIRSEVSISVDDGFVVVSPVAKTRLAQSLWGTYASHAKNMIIGVTEGYKKELEVEGVGYRSEVSGTDLVLHVGFSHPVSLPVPEGLSVSVKDNVITVSGFDKELVTSFAAEVRQVKKPEPYKGKGIRYVGEVIRRKQGKKLEAQA